MEALMRTIIYFALSLWLMGCTTYSTKPVTHFYDYQLASPEGEPIALTALPQALKNADVILVGEWHTHPAIHRFQTDLLEQLNLQKRDVALSMEQFSRDSQPVLNRYLAGEIGEQYLISQANAWPNYESDYRPLVEYAKAHNIDTIAANAPKSIVRCIGKVGIEYLDRLPAEQRQHVARQVDMSSSLYKEKFMASMHHGSAEQTENQFAAQITWDETMAESIVEYLTDHPNSQVMHIAGKFHTQQGLGTANSIFRRNPNLKIVVITPVEKIQPLSPDFQLEVLPVPTAFIQPNNRMQAYKQLATRNAELSCK
ncbi:hypothetical protein HGG78_01985 [Vibrio aestuarianus]|nr:hypothetical protein [Vibrio sp. 1180_3]NGZ12541.1 hypothetical protein [Vibrio aestuarianus]NGZ62193.1 hypothetical protein [Vibrio aestuarianus subsp. cardii]NGZ17455.1 hypothetical protein [Vibrio aestuarianus]NGZ92007.1 hypothetical protein [Vibrio aestuarianus subsp. cardii]